MEVPWDHHGNDQNENVGVSRQIFGEAFPAQGSCHTLWENRLHSLCKTLLLWHTNDTDNNAQGDLSAHKVFLPNLQYVDDQGGGGAEFWR